MDTQVLKEIGLSDSELRVYLALNKLGPCKSGSIVDASNLQNPVVHRAFHSLSSKGLLRHTYMGKIKYYDAVEPENLLHIIEQQRTKLNILVPQLKKLKQEKSSSQVNLHKGKKAVRLLLNNVLEGSEEFLSYGAPKMAEDILGDFFWKRFNAARIENKVNTKMIFNASHAQRARELNKTKYIRVKVTTNEFEELVETMIVDNSVIIVTYLEEPFAIHIQDKHAANSYRNFFELMWKAAQ